jgi:prevent-host-death family protein
MRVPIPDAEAQLDELVGRAERGEEIVLTRDGRSTVLLVPVGRPALDSEERMKILKEIQTSAAAKATPGPDAAHCADFLYDEYGLPK